MKEVRFVTPRFRLNRTYKVYIIQGLHLDSLGSLKGGGVRRVKTFSPKESES